MFHRQESRAAATTARLADAASQGADDAIRSTQRVAGDVLDRLADDVQDVHDRAAPRLVRMAEQAEGLVRRGADVVRDRSQQLREGAYRASDYTRSYIRDEPLKSVLIAAFAGAAVIAIANLLSRRRGY
jgi:ElaB/YqjD/DUF883 family membrane-anchored ribosome-binding protein